MRTKTISLALAAVTLTAPLCLGGCGAKPVTFNDKDGKAFAELSTAEVPEAQEFRCYTELALKDAKEILAKRNSITVEKAEKELLEGGYTVETCLDRELYKNIETVYKRSSAKDLPFGCAITDLNGGLAAVWGTYEEGICAALGKYSPYSSLKPLSVYAPAIESGKAYWSKTYEDSPFSQTEDELGEKQPWPENATGVYAEKGVTVSRAIQESLNTVAVKCLNEYGVTNSIQFLRGNFNLDLSFELERALNGAERDVLGNLAMGYTYTGVSPVEMAGCYQIFANGGEYLKPCTVSKITDADGKLIYTAPSEKKRVISEKTSYIMNRLLQRVTEPGGTGSKARIKDVEVGGKTGTGTANDSHWFSGFVPGYTCAVWHGGEVSDNYSPELFAKIMAVADVSGKSYPTCDGVKEAVYCEKTGLLAGKHCGQIDKGYYFADSLPETCKDK